MESGALPGAATLLSHTELLSNFLHQPPIPLFAPQIPPVPPQFPSTFLPWFSGQPTSPYGNIILASMSIPQHLQHYRFNRNFLPSKISVIPFMALSTPPRTARTHTSRRNLPSVRSAPFSLDSNRCMRWYRRSQRFWTTRLTV